MDSTPPDIDYPKFEDEFAYQDYLHQLADESDNISDEKLVQIDKEVRELETDYISEILAQGLL